MDIFERTEKIPKFPKKLKLPPLPFNIFDENTQFRGMIGGGKVPSGFSPDRFKLSRIFFIDESGSPDSEDSNVVFQIGLLYGNELDLLFNINQEVDKLRSEWPGREGQKSFFHHSKDPVNRREKFEEYCLKLKNISLLHYKVNKEKLMNNQDYKLKKKTLYFSILLSALRFIHYSHGNILLIVSDRPKTFSDDLIYELQRQVRIQSLIDMIYRTNVGCCLPILHIRRERARDNPVLDICDYLISIIGRGNCYRWINNYGGCSLSESAKDFMDWEIIETFYSKESPFEEGKILSILKRPINEPKVFSSIIDRISTIKNLSSDIRTLIREIKFSSNHKFFVDSVLLLSSLVGPELDNKYAALPLNKEEYTCIKTIGACVKLFKDYGISKGKGIIKEKYYKLISLKWR